MGLLSIAAAAAGIAKFLFFLFLVACLMFLVIGISEGSVDSSKIKSGLGEDGT